VNALVSDLTIEVGRYRMAPTQRIASDPTGSKDQPEKKKPKKRNPRKKTSSTPSPSTSQSQATRKLQEIKVGEDIYEVGTEYEVLHFSSLRWQRLELKRIEVTQSGVIQFSFFSVPPGWMTVGEDRVRPIKKKKRNGRKRV
jgi:hypothetical protein